MTKISYSVGEEFGAIYWSAAEEFSELRGKTFKLGDMEAVEIEKMDNFSLVARILLSAVAGATIQHLLDKKIDSDEIFQHGTFRIE
jgi:hypothetical protein